MERENRITIRVALYWVCPVFGAVSVAPVLAGPAVSVSFELATSLILLY